jgi:hypothetical protein
MDNTSNTPKNDIILPDTIVVPARYCALMYNMVQVITKRGGINPDEFVIVGELYAFLKKELKVDQQDAIQKADASQ